MEKVVIDGSCTLTNILDGDAELSSVIEGVTDKIVRYREAVYYTGSYSFTPAAETQTIPIAQLTASEDITIEPIPSNYGLITWNGSTLTVS